MCLSCNLTEEFVEGVDYAVSRANRDYVNNKSEITLSKNLFFDDRSKHINTCYRFIRECIKRKEIQSKYVKSHY